MNMRQHHKSKTIICNDCGKEKEPYTKELCHKCYSTKYYQINKQIISQRAKIYYKNNKQKKKQYRQQHKKESKTYRKNYWENNKEELKQQHRQYYKKNKEKLIKYAKTYRQNNKQQILQLNNEYYKKKYETTPIFRLNKLLSRTMARSLKHNKNNQHWETLVDYTLYDLKKHLEKQFKDGMTWKNQSKVWHIDHRIPISWFTFKSYKDIEFKECWALDNLQPKLKADNLTKSNRYAEPTLKQWQPQ